MVQVVWGKGKSMGYQSPVGATGYLTVSQPTAAVKSCSNHDMTSYGSDAAILVTSCKDALFWGKMVLGLFCHRILFPTRESPHNVTNVIYVTSACHHYIARTLHTRSYSWKFPPPLVH